MKIIYDSPIWIEGKERTKQRSGIQTQAKWGKEVLRLIKIAEGYNFKNVRIHSSYDESTGKFSNDTSIGVSYSHQGHVYAYVSDAYYRATENLRTINKSIEAYHDLLTLQQQVHWVRMTKKDDE